MKIKELIKLLQDLSPILGDDVALFVEETIPGRYRGKRIRSVERLYVELYGKSLILSSELLDPDHPPRMVRIIEYPYNE